MMKKTNKLFIIMMILVLLSSCGVVKKYNYENKEDTVVSMQINNPVMKVNGIETEIDAENHTSPEIVNGRTMLPLRTVIEAFGGNVSWNSIDKTVILSLEDDTVILAIGNTTAYCNDKKSVLDTAPAIINGRTMLPVRYVAESFNLGVAWDNSTKTIYIVRNGFDETEQWIITKMIPEYSGQPYAVINENKPFFKDYEIIPASFEFYADLDELGRCDVAMASVGKDIMPTGKRESISSVKPTGWINTEYDGINGGYLYNRCHLIGFQLTGENANERNLITGTRYMNIEGMLDFENMIDEYVEDTDNNVLYRVTPVFIENNIVADGVLMEAYSVNDGGAEISFCVYCYNVQPGISIDYATGESNINSDYKKETNYKEETSHSDYLEEGYRVYRTATGKKYHSKAKCGGRNSYEISLEEALNSGLEPCLKCCKQ